MTSRKQAPSYIVALGESEVGVTSVKGEAFWLDVGGELT